MTEGLSVLVLYNTNPPGYAADLRRKRTGRTRRGQRRLRGPQGAGHPPSSGRSAETSARSRAFWPPPPNGIVFNLVEGFAENPADATMVPSLCRAWRRGWTGNDSAAQLLTLDKWQTKAALRQNGLPTPQALIIEQDSKIRGELFPGPYIVKPLRADASEGIDSRSVVTARDERLYDAVSGSTTSSANRR